MFIDYVKVFIKSGKGGDGCVSFHREKFLPKGGPDGGDGGDGGNVIFIGDSNINTLERFRFSKKIEAENGKPGQGNRKFGKKGKDLKIKVPLGTIIRNIETNEIICEVIHEKEHLMIASGGKGGRGNFHFKTSTNQAPRKFEKGEEGIEFNAIMELKIIADVGLLGLPNAGKSSLISVVTEAKPKIANYPFTTLIPNLGVVDLPDFRTIIIADIPGIIEGASEGKGLGIKFLKHVERTKILLLVIDVSMYASCPPIEAYKQIIMEMNKFQHGLQDKKYLIAANKIDLDNDLNSYKEFVKQLPLKEKKKVFSISAVTKKGLKELILALDKELESLKDLDE